MKTGAEAFDGNPASRLSSKTRAHFLKALESIVVSWTKNQCNHQLYLCSFSFFPLRCIIIASLIQGCSLRIWKARKRDRRGKQKRNSKRYSKARLKAHQYKVYMRNKFMSRRFRFSFSYHSFRPFKSSFIFSPSNHLPLQFFSKKLFRIFDFIFRHRQQRQVGSFAVDGRRAAGHWLSETLHHLRSAHFYIYVFIICQRSRSRRYLQSSQDLRHVAT